MLSHTTLTVSSLHQKFDTIDRVLTCVKRINTLLQYMVYALVPEYVEQLSICNPSASLKA